MLASKGYTLIEILIVVAIAAIIFTIGYNGIKGPQNDVTQPVQTMRSK